MFYKVSGAWKIFWIRGGRTEVVSRYSVNFFCLTVPKNFVGEPFYFYKISRIEIFMDKRLGMNEGGVSRYSIKNFLSQKTEKLRRDQFCA